MAEAAHYWPIYSSSCATVQVYLRIYISANTLVLLGSRRGERWRRGAVPYISSRADTPTLPTVPCLTRRAAAVSHRTPSTEKNQSGQGRRMHLSVLFLN